MRVRGRHWRVDAVTRGDDCTALRLREMDSARALTLLTPFDRTITVERPTKPHRIRPRRWMHALDRTLAGLRPFGGLAALAASTTRLLPYQLEPALAMLRHGSIRVLVADGVGLGKTIEAGIVLLELAARSDSFRAIVLVPAGLRDQWAAELATHFHLTTTQANAAWLRAASFHLPLDVNPWSLPGIYIASHDFVKRPEALRPIESVTWDLAIVDEVHAASAGTDRRAAIHALACRSRRVMLLTATPNAGDDAQFKSLCDIGRIDRAEAPITLFARTRRDVDAGRPRKSLVLAVQPSAAEHQMHRLLERYSRRVWKEAGARGDERARLVSIILRKRALSSASSLLSSVMRRMQLLGRPDRDEAEQLSLPLGSLTDEDPLEDDEPQRALAIPGLDDPVRERRWLAAIAEAARAAARAESKSRALIRLLRRVRQPAIVFTEYRDTLIQIEQSVTALPLGVVLLHGGLSPAERTRATHAFNRGGYTLLATDAASEGLNLHHHCRLVIHYELPWNPARLEQRAGRVDRLGQERRVHEVALVASDTAERLVIAPLAARAASGRSGPGGSQLLDALSESDVAQAVMDDGEPRSARHSNPMASAATTALDLEAEATAEAERLDQERRWRARSDRNHTRRDGRLPVLSTTKRRRSVGTTGRILIYQLAIEDNDGSKHHDEALAIHVADSLDADMANEQIRHVIEKHERDLMDRVVPLDARLRAVIAERDAAIDSIRTSAAQMLVQQDLFDRRVARHPQTADAPLLVTNATEPPHALHPVTTLLAVLHLRP